ncbi:MAG TPA: hypothetical protein VFZ89_16005 [Solirubrobacteraceae bacterium]
MKTSYETALRSLDAADPDPRATPAAATRPRRRRAPRLTLAGAAATVAVAIVAIAVRDGGDASGVAYASWTPAPSAVAAHDLDAVVDACRDQLDTGAIPVALAERRGNFVAVLFHKNNPDIAASCVAWNTPGSSKVEHVRTGIGGSSGPAWTPAPGRITQGMVADFAGAAAFTEGAVGRGVVGVTIHAGAETVTATIANGRYAAWWPGSAFGDGPNPKLLLTYDVRLADGTVKRDVAPALPR